MRFEAIHIDGFGLLHDVDFQLTPGLNVFYGPNEVGKSTLEQAIWALLYGFYSSDRRQTQETALLQRYRPWTNDTYAGHLVYVLDGGKPYKVVRNFDDGDLQTSIWEPDTGRDITSTFNRGKLGRVSFAHDHFGMSEEVFVNTCFVRQADLRRLEEAAQAITETVVNLAGTGSQDRSVGKAVELLEDAFREQVGTPRATKKPLPMAQSKLEGFKREKQDILGFRAALEADYGLRAQLKERRGQISQNNLKIQYLYVSSLRDGLATKVGKARKIQSQKSDLEGNISRLHDVSDFPLGQRDAVARQYQEWLTSRTSLAKVRGEWESFQAEINGLRRKRQDLIDLQRPLETARDIPLDQEESVREIERRWRDASTEAQRIRDELLKSQASAEELKDVSDLAERNAAVFQVGPKVLGDLRLMWDVSEGKVRTAAQELDAVQQAWQGQPLSVEDFEQSRKRLGDLNVTALSRLQAMDNNAQKLLAEANIGLPATAIWGVLVTGGVILIAGLGLLMISLSARSMAWAAGGLAALVLGGAIASIATYQLVRKRGVARQAIAAVGRLQTELKQIGFESVRELEAAYDAYLKAQPLYDQLSRAQAKLQREQDALTQFIEHGRTTLGLAPETSLTVHDVDTAEQLAQRLAIDWPELKKRETFRDGLAQKAMDTQKAALGIEGELRGVLRSAHFDAVDLGHDVRRYYELCNNRRALEKLEAERGTLDARLERYDAKASEVTASEIAHDGAKTQLQRMFRQVGILDDDLEQGFRVFQSQGERAETLGRHLDQVGGLGREEQALLGGKSLIQLQEEFAQYLRAVEGILATNPAFAGLTTTDSLETLQIQIARLQNDDKKAEIDLAAVEERINRAWSGVRSLPEVEEDIQAAVGTIAALEFHGQALELARKKLADAADEHHRNFLPRLNQVVGQSLSRVTGGRYKEVQIDHADLQVRIQVPELPNPVTPDVLSRGAQEQIYLLLRLGLTQLMSSGREKLPLMLDDPLVNYDADRLLRGLEFLTELADHTQVLLFTKDKGTANWFESMRKGESNHRLHQL